MNPTDGLIPPPENTIGFGVARFVRLNALKNSVLNCKLVFSDTAMFFNRDRSTSARPGPRSVPRPKFPHVPISGKMNAFGSNHRVWFCRSTGPEKEGFTEGRSG